MDSSENTGTLAMQIIVEDTKNFGYLELCRGLANAFPDFLDRVATSPEWSAHWEAWNAQDYRKVVRRAKGSLWTRITEEEQGATYTNEAGPSFHIVPPRPMTEISRNISRAQVSNLQTPRQDVLGADPEGTHLAVVLNESLGMSAGKAAAASLHAVQKAVESGDTEWLAIWMANGRPVSLEQSGEFPLDSVDVRIADNGHTEVEPGSVTAVAFYR